MPLFRRESRSQSSGSNGTANTKQSKSPIVSPSLATSSNSNPNLPHLNLNPVSSASSINSAVSSTYDSIDGDHSKRVNRSSSVSQKFKNLFTATTNSSSGHGVSNTNDSNSQDSIKRVNSSSSLSKQKNTYTDNQHAEQSKILNNTKSPIPHPLPIPDRTLGRPVGHSMQIPNNNTNNNGGPINSKNISSNVNDLSTSINKLKLQQQLQPTNDISSELSSSSSTINLEQPKHSRIRSSTVSGNFYHTKQHQTQDTDSKDDLSTLQESYYPTRDREREKDPRKLQGLHHSETVNYSSAHLKNERDQTIKLTSGRIQLYDFGRSHEHDYSKYRTHPSSKPLGLFNWMKKKDSKTDKDEPYEIIEKSVSLLPDKYSGDLMRVKNNPKNYIWNYDEDDEDDDEDDENESYDDSTDDDVVNAKTKSPSHRKMSSQSIHSSRSIKSRQSVRLTKHYNSDDEYENENDYYKDMETHRNENEIPLATIKRKSSTDNGSSNTENDEDGDDDDDEEEDDYDDSDDDDDFDDEIDNMMIEPIIGKEQVFLINSMLNKIEHPEKFKLRLREKEKEGKIKLTLAQKYGHIEGFVGKGSYGTVCISSKPVNNTKIYFAIKQIKRKPGENLHHFGNRVTSEFMISSSLTHQAVINVYDLMVDPVSMTYSEIMEFIPCGDLFSLISATNGLHIVECDCFFKQILNAITYLHSVGVSHNDLKVENLLLTRKGQLKIIDFGTSAVFRTAWESDVQLSRGACGSERYVAPEQYLKDRDYDPRLGDVWSLGVIYLTMYYGKYAWEAAKISDETFAKFIEARANFDYTKKSATKAHQFSCIKKGSFGPIENINGGILHSWIAKSGNLDSNIRNNEEDIINDSRKYVLYNILNPDPTFRMRTYQVWQSEWIKNFHVCDAGRGYVSYDNYIEMALKSAQDLENKEREGADLERISSTSKLERKESKRGHGHGFLGFGTKQ